MVPSVKTLLRIPGLSREDAVRLRKVLDGRLAPQDVDPRIEREHVGAPPSFQWEAKMRAADIILGTHGVEWLGYECSRWSNNPQGFDYCNAGDTYSTTLIHTAKGHFRVACWGDLVEAHERKCGECRRRNA